MDALDGLAPLDDAYAARPVGEAFTWSGLEAHLPVGHEWYLVAFRSVRRPGCDEARLCDFDEHAHREAEASPGFVHYFKGPTASDGTCLSFCLWESRAHARSAAGGPQHRAAVGLLHEMYERYTLEFLRVSHPDASGPLRFEAYDPVPADAPDDLGPQPLPTPPLAIPPLPDLSMS